MKTLFIKFLSASRVIFLLPVFGFIILIQLPYLFIWKKFFSNSILLSVEELLVLGKVRKGDEVIINGNNEMVINISINDSRHEPGQLCINFANYSLTIIKKLEGHVVELNEQVNIMIFGKRILSWSMPTKLVSLVVMDIFDAPGDLPTDLVMKYNDLRF